MLPLSHSYYRTEGFRRRGLKNSRSKARCSSLGSATPQPAFEIAEVLYGYEYCMCRTVCNWQNRWNIVGIDGLSGAPGDPSALEV